MRFPIAALLCCAAIAANADVFGVDSSEDSGPGTLRWAIQQANAKPGLDLILARSCFYPCPPILLKSRLPEVTDATDLSLIGTEIDGRAAGHAPGLVLLGDGSSIIGVWLYGFDGNGLELRGNKQTARSVTIGRREAPLQGDGIVIGGNDVAVEFAFVEFCRRGVVVESGLGATLIGNQLLRNRAGGLAVQRNAAKSIIGGIPPDICFGTCPPPSGNLASENGEFGIRIDGDECALLGNYLDSNDGAGLIVNGLRNHVESNSALNNHGAGYVVLAPADVSANAGACNSAGLVSSRFGEPPMLRWASSDAHGTSALLRLHGVPHGRYVVTFVADTCPETDHDTALRLVDTDAEGAADVTPAVRNFPRPYTNATAFVTDRATGTSWSSSLPVPVLSRGYAGADLAVSLSSDATVVNPGDFIPVRITVTNHGPAAAAGATVDVSPSPNAVFDFDRSRKSSPSRAYGFCYDGFCIFPPIAAGESLTALYFVRIMSGRGLTVHATQKPAESDTDPTNNQAYLGIGGRRRAAPP